MLGTRYENVFEIEDYEVWYPSNSPTFEPHIWLVRNGEFFCRLVFKPNESSLEPASEESVHFEREGESHSLKIFSLNYHLLEFYQVLDLLRNERPAYLYWGGPRGQNGIRTRRNLPG